MTDGAAPAPKASTIGPDTCVWLWDIDTDALPDMAQSLLALGYAADARPHRQASWDELIHPDDRPGVDTAYERHVAGKADLHECTYRVLDARGAWHWMVERGRIVERHPDGRPRRVVGTLTDITLRRQAEATALQAASRLEKIAAHVPGVLYQMEMQPDGRSRFLYISRQTESLFGVTSELATAAGTDMFASVLRDDRALLAETIQASARDLTPWRHEFRLLRPGGTTLWVMGTSSPQREPDGRTVWHGYLQDVTERRELEEARQAAAVAAAASRAKSEFLSRMSHELRTPLNAVLGFAQLMEIDESEPPTEGQRRRLRHIREAGDHLLQMIGELLDLTRIESGTLSLATEAVPLRALANEALAMVQTDADKAQVMVHLQSHGDPVALADRMRLRQVLLNLLSNAIKYNRSGGRVQVHVEGGATRVRLEVSDTGPGLQPEQQARLFQAFDRLGAEQGGVEGTGIGLALSKALVDLMGGQIGVRSVPGHGSTFWVDLPRGCPPAQLPMPMASTGLAALPALPAPGPVRRVLYIEDNRVNQIVVESMLARLPGVQVVLASDPVEGLATAIAQVPDLVLLDIQLPVMSGYEVLQRLRAHAATARVPVIAVTANAMPDDVRRASDAGFDDYVTKPLDLQRLLGAVSAWLPPA